ncbi:hypothetical protein BS17DRAFT_813295 [Gyrodon lividus]|nr:hypothetical protein BS17DRAFT_813295 [Gyrodon lividus]
MGLAGRKQKQRIQADPRNLSWADDASRFGLSYLSKFGWDTSQGLGSSGEGIKTHLKVSQKLDMMGIGAQHQKDPNGIAWKQNREFEALLKRLNKGVEGQEVRGEGEGEGEETEGGSLHMSEASQMVHLKDQQSKDKKRKRKALDGDDAMERSKKKRKQEKNKKTDFDPSENATSADPSDRKDDFSPSPQKTVTEQPQVFERPEPRIRPMAHRARIRAAKRLSTKSAAAISEILGIAPAPTPSSSSTSLLASSSTSPAPTPGSLDPAPTLPIVKLTTSSKSLADYFREKLGAKSSSSSGSTSTSTTPGLGHAPRTTIADPVANANTDADADVDVPKRGLGSSCLPVPYTLSEPRADFGLGSSQNSNSTLLASFVPSSHAPIENPLGQTPSDSGAGSTQPDDELTERQREKAQRKEQRRSRREATALAVAGDVKIVKEEEEEGKGNKEGVDGDDTSEGKTQKDKSKKNKKGGKEKKESKTREKRKEKACIEHADSPPSSHYETHSSSESPDLTPHPARNPKETASGA